MTNISGEAELMWKPPAEVGAYRDVGPCANGVAASVSIRPMQTIAALENRLDPFSLCVPILRDVKGVVRASQPVVTAGDTLHVHVEEGGGKPWSLFLVGNDGSVTRSAWADDGEKGVDVSIPSEARGLFSVSAVSPSEGKRGRAVHTAVLVKPRVLPELAAKIGGGRAAPGGKVFVDAVLSDGKGQGLKGTVAALVFYLHGGGSARGLWSLDTRRRLCSEAGIEEERCRDFLEGPDAMQSVRRALVGGAASGLSPLDPRLDPAADVDEALRQAFRMVVHSLEGAILEASTSPDRLRDVRRKGAGGRWEFNPELWTLVTAAMSDPPKTPGGEPFVLSDLVDIDRQVEFDRVARRVTRLKLMRVLINVRAFVRSNYTDPDEPALSDPAALLRRLVADGIISSEDLLDPWGGTMQFVRSAGPHLPFLSLRGHRLQAPGPDGRIGTQDDVRDPFERVLRSKTPYAEAVGEDRLVDARLDMQVSDATVDGWISLIESLTGTSLGLSGISEGGGGRGSGIGLGSVGTIGHGRAGFGITTENVVWLPPKRTDDAGRVRLEVPLGEIETTWRVALVAVADEGQSSVAQVDVPSALDVSARVDAGARWVAGDRVDVRVSLRNRTKSSVSASLSIAAGGVASLADKTDASKSVTIPAMGATTVSVPVTTQKAGPASLQVRTRTAGIAEDVVTHHWDVLPQGERTRVTQTAWLEASADVSLPFAPNRRQPLGPTQLIVERGRGPVLKAALDALDPDRLVTKEEHANALEVALRIRRWAVARGGESDPLARQARVVAERARGRLVVHAGETALTTSASNIRARLRSVGGPMDLSMFPEPAECPPNGAPTLRTAIDWLDVEPPPKSGVVEACWDAFVTDASEVVIESRDPVALAHAVLALSERSHRRALAHSLVERLRKLVKPTAAGWIRLGGGSADDRASRSVVYAALLRAAKGDETKTLAVDRLAAWLLVQRDPYGGYGSTLATRSAVRALTAFAPETSSSGSIGVIVDGKRHEVKLGPGNRTLVELGPRVTSAKIETNEPGVLVRLERSALRLWSEAPRQPDSPVHMDLTWPSSARVGVPGRLQVNLRHDLGRPVVVDARIPLPPGVTLAAPVQGVRQVQGVLAIRRSLDDGGADTVLQIPLRFSLSGQFTAPESYARLAFEDGPRAIASARPVMVKKGR